MNTSDRKLFQAVRAEDVDAVRALIRGGVDVNAEEQPGVKAVDVIPGNNTYKAVEILDLLINAGADFNARTNPWSNVVAAAVGTEEKHPGLLRLLIESGADINFQNREGTTPLMRAAKWFGPESVKQLIDSGADLDIRDNKGRTALMYILTPEDYFETINYESVALLIDAGTDVNAQDDNGDSPLTMLSLYSHPGSIEERLLPMVEQKVRGEAVDLKAFVADFLRSPPPPLEPTRPEPDADAERAVVDQIAMELLEEQGRLFSENGYLALKTQFERFLDERFVPDRQYKVDSFEPEAFIYDEEGDIDGSLDFVDLLGERMNRFFGTHTQSDLGRAVRRVLHGESDREEGYRVRSLCFKKFFIIRHNKVLEMHGYITIRLGVGTAAEARLSYISDAYLRKVREKANEHAESCFIRYRDIPF